MKKVKPLTQLAMQIIKILGNSNPTTLQTGLLESLLSTTFLSYTQKLIFQERLTVHEASCLFWAARGKTAKETAKILSVNPAVISKHRKEIKRKLNCESIIEAVFKGMHYDCLLQEGSSLDI